MQIETLAVHTGRKVDATTGAVAPPIHLSTTFERDAEGSFGRGFSYARADNPNRSALEQALAALEGGTAAAAFSSGLAAAAAVFQTLSPGDHVVAGSDLYHGTRLQLQEIMGRWGISSDFVDTTHLEAVQAALRPETRLVWLETPSNPLLTITDIAAVARLAHERGTLCVCDNTFATPVLQRPLDLGADLVVHSTTKYLGGHSDVQGGAVIVRQADGVMERVRLIQQWGGAVPSAFTCWLTLRSLPTLPLRVRAQAEVAARIAGFLAGHAAVRAVHYPGLVEHPGHEVAKRQMSGYGGMISFQVAGGAEAAKRVVARAKLFTRATSLGGIESLIEHRASSEGPHSRTPVDLIRLSIGLEHPDDLAADLAQALA